MVLISFPILFISTSFLVSIGKEMSLPGLRRSITGCFLKTDKVRLIIEQEATWTTIQVTIVIEHESVKGKVKELDVDLSAWLK